MTLFGSFVFLDTTGTYRVVAFITEQKVIRKILTHLEKRKSDSRSPPEP